MKLHVTAVKSWYGEFVCIFRTLYYSFLFPTLPYIQNHLAFDRRSAFCKYL